MNAKLKIRRGGTPKRQEMQYKDCLARRRRDAETALKSFRVSASLRELLLIVLASWRPATADFQLGVHSSQSSVLSPHL